MVTINTTSLSETIVPIKPPSGSSARPPARPSVEPVEEVRVDTSSRSGESAREQKIDLEELVQAVDQLQNVARLANRSVHFRINETGDDVQVLVVNEDTDEVIREIPPDAVLELAERIQGTLGLLIDKVV